MDLGMTSWPSGSYDARLFLIDNRNTRVCPDLMQAGAFRVLWLATTADGRVRRRHKRLCDTSGCATQVKTLDIFRSKEKGNCLGSVGRWGLLKQALGAFSALKPLQWPVYRGFRAGDSGIFVKNDPNCHSPRCQFGAQSGKTESLASRPWAIASRFE